MKRAVRWLLGVGLLISLLGLSSQPWWVELLGHARLSYLLFGMCLLPLVRERVAALLWLSALAVNLACVTPLYFGGSTGSAAGKLLLCNALSSNETPERVLDLLVKEQADVVVLLEVRPALLQILAPVMNEYPGQMLNPRPDNFGMAVLSRNALQRQQVVEDEGMPFMLADTEVGGRLLHVIGAHPVPPMGREWARRRNEQVVRLGALLRESPRPFALLGDLNNTPWSPSLAPIREASVTARAGFGVQTTWPTLFPPFLRIAIDQCFVSPEVRVVDCHSGPAVGSDHFPLVVKVAW